MKLYIFTNSGYAGEEKKLLSRKQNRTKQKKDHTQKAGINPKARVKPTTQIQS